jgi:hypothetical protein
MIVNTRDRGRVFLCLLLAVISLALAGCGAQEAPYETVAPASITAGDPIPVPSGDVILTVTGAITAENSDNGLVFDLETLEKLGLVKYTVTDPWLTSSVTYTGVLMSDLLKAAGASTSATTVQLTALDDYQVGIPIADIQKWPVLLATQSNGEYMSIEAGGPTRIAFPYDQYSEIDQVAHKDFWVWSISQMEVR